MKIINEIAELFSGMSTTVVNMFHTMDPTMMAVVSIGALVVAGMCLRGNPVRGA